MCTCLVTGGAGFIGSHVAAELIKKGCRVVVLDDLSGGFVDNVPHGAKFIEGSVLDVGLLETVFRTEKINRVFHLAAYAAEGLSHFIKNFNYMNNVIGSINLINCSVNHSVDVFVFTSSIAVYGSNQLPMMEDTIPLPEDSYGIAKYAVELDLQESCRMFGLPYIIFRPHNVYGENQNIGDQYRNVIGIFMNKIMTGEPMPIFGDGEQTRAFTHIADVAPVIAISPDNPRAYCNIFNVGADIPYSVNHLSEVVAEAMGVEKKISHKEARKEVIHAYANHDKLRQYFDWKPKISLQEGVRRMASWAKHVGPRKSKDFTAIEIQKNLPLSWRISNSIQNTEAIIKTTEKGTGYSQ